MVWVQHPSVRPNLLLANAEHCRTDGGCPETLDWSWRSRATPGVEYGAYRLSSAPQETGLRRIPPRDDLPLQSGRCRNSDHPRDAGDGGNAASRLALFLGYRIARHEQACPARPAKAYRLAGAGQPA